MRYCLLLFVLLLSFSSCAKKEYNDDWFSIEKNYVDIPQKKYDYVNPIDKSDK